MALNENEAGTFTPRQLKYLTYMFLSAVEPNFDKLPLELQEALWATYYATAHAIGTTMPQDLTLEAFTGEQAFLQEAALKHLLSMFRSEPGVENITDEQFLEALEPEALQEIVETFVPVARTMLELKPTLLLMETLIDFDADDLAEEWETFNKA